MPAVTRLTGHEAWVAQNATSYVSTKFLGGGKYERIESPDLVTARQVAADMCSDRGVLIYAVYRQHQAMIETVNPGESIMSKTTMFHLINFAVDPFKIVGYTTQAALTEAAAKPDHAGFAQIVEVGDLNLRTEKELLDLYNFLAEKPIKAFAEGHAPAEHAFSMLTTGQPITAPTAEGDKPKASDDVITAAAKKADAKKVADAAKAAEKAEVAAKKAAKKAEPKKVPTYMNENKGKAVRVGTSLENILRALLAGKYTLAQITAKSGVAAGVYSAEDKVLHRIRHVLYIDHGIRHSVDDKGIFTGLLPKGFTEETIFAKPKPKAEPSADKQAKADAAKAKKDKAAADKKAKADKAAADKKAKADEAAAKKKAANTVGRGAKK